MSFSLFKGVKHAQLYAKYRPYPPDTLIQELIDYLNNKVKLKPPFNKAIDIGCGSGQSTVILSPYFKKVLGLDISEAQINNAKKINNLNNIEYKISDCIQLPVLSNSVELITLCQSLHWFNPPDDLYKEIQRVLIPHGVIAAYGYWIPIPKTLNDKQNAKISELIMQYLHEEMLGVYWDKERYIVQNHYKDIHFPFKDFQRFAFVKKSQSSLADYMGYLSTWSSYQKLIKENPDKARKLLEEIEERLKDILKETECSENLTLYTDYFLLMGCV